MSLLRLVLQTINPSAPPANTYRLFVGSDGNLKKINPDTTIVDLEASVGALMPGDNVSDLINDAGYITAATAPVTSVNGLTGPVVITDATGSVGTHNDVDLSTAPILNDALVWDGTAFVATEIIPAAGNVSGFTNDAGYLTSETITSLSLSANTLSYVDENGDSTDIDLSLYLDDTNLSRLTGGVLDGGTGIATFTRDDSSTFTVDFSAFLAPATLTSDDVTNSSSVSGANVTNALDTLNASKLSFSAPQDDIITELPTASAANAGKLYSVQVNDGSYEYWEDFQDFIKSTTPAATTSGTPQTFLTGTLNLPADGDYIVETSYMWSFNSTGGDFEGELLVNGASFFTHVQEPQDAGGGGITVDNLVGTGTLGTGTNQRFGFSQKQIAEGLTAGANTFAINISSGNGSVAAIYEANIIVTRLRKT